MGQRGCNSIEKEHGNMNRWMSFFMYFQVGNIDGYKWDGVVIMLNYELLIDAKSSEQSWKFRN